MSYSDHIKKHFTKKGDGRWLVRWFQLLDSTIPVQQRQYILPVLLQDGMHIQYRYFTGNRFGEV